MYPEFPFWFPRQLKYTPSWPPVGASFLRLAWCSFTHPNLSQSCKLRLVSQKEEFRAADDTRKKALTLCKFTIDLRLRVHRESAFAWK
jgi:hypothetical protein